MDLIHYAAPQRVLVTARGHPYQRDPFLGLFGEPEDSDICLVEQPAAQALMRPGLRDQFDCCVCYDMPGVDFVNGTAAAVTPTESFKQGFMELLEAGMGFVFLHHSLASWPDWDTFARIVGGRFLYRPAEFNGEPWPDSGYRHEVEHQISVLCEHPVTAGLPAKFDMTDELYLCPVLEDDVIPLLRSNYQFDDQHFYSANHAVQGRMFDREGWQHPTGSALVGWVKHYANSPIVYLQGGDDVSAYTNPHFQRLLHNAIRWVSSDSAGQWARQRNQESAA